MSENDEKSSRENVIKMEMKMVEKWIAKEMKKDNS